MLSSTLLVNVLLDWQSEYLYGAASIFPTLS